MLLSDGDIRAHIDAGRIGLEPYDPSMVQPSSVDVRLDRYFRVFENHRYPHIDPAQEQPDLTRLVEPKEDDPFILHPGEFVLGSTYEVVTLPDDVSARLEGKALSVDTPIPTPDGWLDMGELGVGDQVFDEHGRRCFVVAATGIMLGRPCRRVHFSDGTSLVADADHQWITVTRSERMHGRHLEGRVRTTDEIGATLRAGTGWNHHIPLARPVDYPEQALPIDPYVLGVRLGDGETQPPVPGAYLRGSLEQRSALLQGLMDAGGRVDRRGRCAFVNADERLAEAVHELAASLGLRPTGPVKLSRRGVDCGPTYRVRFTPRVEVLRLRREPARLKKSGQPHAFRAVVGVDEIPTVPVRCVQVSSPSGLFLAGRSFIPTHNSSLGRLGLLTHSTAGFVDAGFSGHVTLELSNVATLPIKLWPGMKIGQLCFFKLTSPAQQPYGSGASGSRYQDQRGPTPSRSHLNFHRTKI